MTSASSSPPLTPTHHAMLFALLAKAVIENTDKEIGGNLICAAVRTYGAQRGRRMALRARANGHALTMANFLAYGERYGNRTVRTITAYQNTDFNSLPL